VRGGCFADQERFRERVVGDAAGVMPAGSKVVRCGSCGGAGNGSVYTAYGAHGFKCDVSDVFGMVNKARTHGFPCSHLAGKLRAAAMVSFCELNRASSHVVGS